MIKIIQKFLSLSAKHLASLRIKILCGSQELTYTLHKPLFLNCGLYAPFFLYMVSGVVAFVMVV
jgi:hypothetical protein